MSSRLQVPVFRFETRWNVSVLSVHPGWKDYVVQTGGRIFALWQKKDTLYYDGVEEEFLLRFLRLDEDLGAILKMIDRDPVIHSAIETYRASG